jgi:4-amino-4-deoxy-L-arabinose transferase-like glycosyltransferase
MVFDDDRYVANKLRDIGFPGWDDVKKMPCHTWIPVKDKYVLQYPPGTGFALSLFPAGFQVIPLYVLANVTIFGFALLGLFRARDPASLTLAAVFGIVAIYLMINPAKASYSVAPTMMACALAGLLTARLFMGGQRHRLVLTALVGLVIGLSVNFRLPNLFLSAGYCLVLFVSFLLARNKETLLQGISFAIAFLAGIAPTLIANTINAGSPLSTTYGGVDAVAPELNSSVLWSYLTNVQFVLLLIACAWTGLLWRSGRQGGVRQLALVVAGNLVANLIFFMTHPLFTPYYTMPIAMLSLWTLLFATLDARSETVRDSLALRQPVKA